MTLENCRRLLKHYNDLVDGTIPAPEHHKDWNDVIHNAKLRAAEMEARIERKLKHPKYAQVSAPKKTKSSK
jgi:hypothetical protein|tara:strand:- start:135 stop:347 length:213 start_codon:yes stop_codon:yes gene_type:complete